MANLKTTWWDLSLSAGRVHVELLTEPEYFVGDVTFRLRITQDDKLVVSRRLHCSAGPDPGESTTYKFRAITFPDLDQSTVQSTLAVESTLGLRLK